ncbi:MAG: 4Fe-4S binding protein [Dysgonamonadaceae bacterium]|jgi:epoxyqueuosine reductase QueG|nr:4Fe-4S binding protein [Dysgonamonadaceae bacterium]
MTNETVKQYGLNAGAIIVGIASADDFGLAPEGFKPADNLAGCLSVIVLGIHSPPETLLKNSVEYTEIRNEMVKKTKSIAEKVAKQIKGNGFKTKVIGGFSAKGKNGRYYGQISLKHAAELAGLGVMTRNFLLTNREHGNLLWLSAVLTDANLVPDKKVEYSFCHNCNKCVEVCPTKALDNPALFSQKKCYEIVLKQLNGKWIYDCFLCRKVCPYRFGE